jgi:2-hydroxychromene-2-carboxylate isomerase
MNSPRVFWFFDVISPFAYLALKQMDSLPKEMSVEFAPILFAGLLNHHGQKGPAEIGPKRRFTYRFALWRAQKLGIPMRMPPSHPFNPLSALRLIIAAGNTRSAIERVFDCVFAEGCDVADPVVIQSLAAELGISDFQSAISAPHVKQQLHENTSFAIQNGVFGVPTLSIGPELFWGHDALEMAVDFWRDPQMLVAPEMAAADALPLGSVRRQS